MSEGTSHSVTYMGTDIHIHSLNNVFPGPVFQSIVSLTSSLRVILLTILADSIHNILIFFAENVSSFCTAKATHTFSAKNFSIFAYHLMEILTNCQLTMLLALNNWALFVKIFFLIQRFCN